jgi:hypothetical protein
MATLKPTPSHSLLSQIGTALLGAIVVAGPDHPVWLCQHARCAPDTVLARRRRGFCHAVHTRSRSSLGLGFGCGSVGGHSFSAKSGDGAVRHHGCGSWPMDGLAQIAGALCRHVAALCAAEHHAGVSEGAVFHCRAAVCGCTGIGHMGAGPDNGCSPCGLFMGCAVDHGTMWHRAVCATGLGVAPFRAHAAVCPGFSPNCGRPCGQIGKP